MSIWQLFKRWRIVSQQKKKYSYTLGEPSNFRLSDSAAQETHTHEKPTFDSLAVSLPYYSNTNELYQRWIMLSPREQEVTALTCLRYTNPQIASRLNLSVETVKTYLEKVLNKFGLKSKADLRVTFANWDFSEWEKPHR
jgi:DNA-binding CsgD family transcriptional regulator